MLQNLSHACHEKRENSSNHTNELVRGLNLLKQPLFFLSKASFIYFALWTRYAIPRSVSLDKRAIKTFYEKQVSVPSTIHSKIDYVTLFKSALELYSIIKDS